MSDVLLNFSTKANTLKDLQVIIQSARIAPLYAFTIREWKTNKKHCVSRTAENLGLGPWIVRSSCGREDGELVSNAGMFLSILDVKKCGLEKAVEKVIKSYGKLNLDDQILIQPMLTHVIRSGVVFSHDPNTSAPYRIINWSDSADTSAVTAGMDSRLWQQAANSPVAPPKMFKQIISLIDELLPIFGNLPLDCEFAVTEESGSEELWLLQARPLIIHDVCQTENSQSVLLDSIHSKITDGMKPHPFLIGNRTVYGVMPDWNPAEIIGTHPKPLALSLYRELVTDSIWAYQRHNYGYRNLRSFPLMPQFYGLPYIDVRLSFNSFIPADLDDGLATRLVDYYINLLLSKPNLHDKVEFEIVFSCYTLDLPQRLRRLKKAGFSEHDINAISESLRKITNRIVDNEKGLWISDFEKLNTLQNRYDELAGSSVDTLERIYWLLEDAKRYGTLPFAGLARAGFVAVQMLQSLVAVGAISDQDYTDFMGDVTTVSGKLGLDKIALNKCTFLEKYGHLRPGTYDILSPRYDETPDLYFDWTEQKSDPETSGSFSLTLPKMQAIEKLLKDHNLQIDAVGLLSFMKSAIELRELSKFHFSRNLSDILVLISDFGAKHSFNKEQLAYSDITVFKELHIAAHDPKEALSSRIKSGKKRYSTAQRISLPPLITQPDDVWAFEWPISSPNFITQKQVQGEVYLISGDLEKIVGSIVCIPSADPGFDWLFSYPIAGLITAWGGANSHMAIRAGESGIPAVIGAGELQYRKWSEAKLLQIDCAARNVTVLA